MRCYRRLPTIKAISFDLDDTLYDNQPILLRAEQAQLNFLQQQVPQAAATTTPFWAAKRRQLFIEQPELCHHIGLCRQQSIGRGLVELGLGATEAEDFSHQAFAVFYHWRNRIELSPQVLTILEQLANRYPLIALTNGNASIESVGLSSLFEFAIAAGDNGLKQKPHSDMFDAAVERLGIQSNELLHVGDSLTSDIQGALNAGCPAVWFNPHHQTMTSKSALPHLDIQDLSELTGC